MFEVGFSELVLVGIVALLVVGPERLPKLAYELGLWIGRLQRYVRDAKFQIENELHNYEIKNSLQQPQRMLEEIKSEIDQAAPRDPWQSPHFTGEPPPVNPPQAENDAAKQESSADDGQTKPRN
jgi:sec-independent protein translocase protein TatB